MTVGGMYNILPIIVKHLEEAEKQQFSVKDICKLSDLSEKTIGKNITRLVNAGYLVRSEFRKPNKPGRVFRYSISPYVTETIKKVLY
jgi:Fic family protein